MLIKTNEIQPVLSLLAPDEPDDSPFQPNNITSGYLKYGLYSRKTIFFHAFYKAYDLEAFKADLRNARTLADILTHLLKYFIPNPTNWTLITTPKRAHTERLGYHFASEVLRITSAETGITFLEDVIGAKDKNKLEPVFFQLKPIPQKTNLIIFDDILTTGKTIYATLDVLKQNPENNLQHTNPLIIIAVNNN
ncbi:MAG: phosphoribosyltransferase [Lentimicrobium sp.]